MNSNAQRVTQQKLQKTQKVALNMWHIANANVLHKQYRFMSFAVLTQMRQEFI